jgi:hypothetical protein
MLNENDCVKEFLELSDDRMVGYEKVAGYCLNYLASSIIG